MTSLHHLVLNLAPPRVQLVPSLKDTDSSIDYNCHHRPEVRPYAVVVDPKTNKIVSKSWEEAGAQQQQQLDQYTKSGASNKSGPEENARPTTQALPPSSFPSNPLATPILHALQGVSRLERLAAETAVSHQSFARGQYLCTGYDLVASYEPTIFEAMACVHFRLRRLIVLTTDVTKSSSPRSLQTSRGVWHRALSRYSIHALPGTNHHFRAFEYYHQPSSSSSSL